MFSLSIETILAVLGPIAALIGVYISLRDGQTKLSVRQHEAEKRMDRHEKQIETQLIQLREDLHSGLRTLGEKIDRIK